MAFHSSSFGNIAAASDETMTPVKMWQFVALDQLLALAHAGRGIALRVLIEELDRLPEQATLGVGHFLDQLAGADHLAAQQRIAAGDHGRNGRS